MKTTHSQAPVRTSYSRPQLRRLTLGFLAIAVIGAAGCGGRAAQKQNRDFFTSGSRDADQRASQRMARDEQLTGSGGTSGEKKVRTDAPAAGGTNKVIIAEDKQALFDRLGGEPGISNILADFTPRALSDPRVNWERKNVKRGGFSIHHSQSVTWEATPEQVAQLQLHMAQFLALATGGPAHYEGKDMKSTHALLHISNTEFDAVIGDLKASLDKLKIANKEQKELLSIVESTRPEIVTER